MAARRRLVRLEDLVGRRVRTRDGHVVGHIEEVVATRLANGDHEVAEFHLGSGALLERLALGRFKARRRSEVIVARWDQIDIHRPDAPLLTCPVEELRHEER
jgi:hypothetical protein